MTGFNVKISLVHNIKFEFEDFCKTQKVRNCMEIKTEPLESPKLIETILNFSPNDKTSKRIIYCGTLECTTLCLKLLWRGEMVSEDSDN